jgi:aminopeptidase N
MLVNILETLLMRRFSILFAIATVAFVIVTVQTDRSAKGQTAAPEPLRMPGDRPIDIQHLRLDLKVDLPKKTVDARASMTVRSLRKINTITLDAVDFEVKKVSYAIGKQGKEVAAHFSQDGGKLIVDLDPPWPADQSATLHIDYRVREPRAGLHFFGPTDAEPEVPLTVWSQGESITNRYWIPCLDQPNQKQSTELVVTVAEGNEVLSNGTLVDRKVNDDKTVTFHWKQEKPHASYLVTLVVGPFDVVTEEWHKKPVMYYVPKGRKDDVARTFGRTPEMLEFFSKRFGVEYPWEKYAQVVVEQFNAGGMENTSATTLTDRALHDQRSMLDSSPDGLISHELGHQWWGDLLTCKDWAHIWLNEGFASYCEVLWAEHSKGKDEAEYELIQKARGAIGGGKTRPVVDHRYPHPEAMFDARAYPKGAWVLNMLRKKLGEEAFWKGIQQYASDFKYQSVETSDFRKVMEKVSGRDLERFFYDWTERPGHPVLEVATEYLPETKQLRVGVKQTQTGEAFHFPLTLAVQWPNSGDGPQTPTTKVFNQDITEKEQVLFLNVKDRPTSVEVDSDLAVLAEIKEAKSHDLWLAQLNRGSSAPASVASRIRAARHFAESKRPEDREALAKTLAEEKFYGVAVEIAAALGESGGDTSRDALIAGLKHENPKVRRACADALGKFSKDAKAAATLKALLEKGDKSYFVEAAAVGAYGKMRQKDVVAVLTPWLDKPSHGEVIRSAALHGLGEAQDPAVLDTLIGWTKRGRSRYDRAAALTALGRLAQTANPTDEQRAKIVTAVSACLEGEQPLILRSAVGTLRDLGRSAAPSLAALEALQRHDPSDRVRDLAKTAIDQIRKNEQTPVELTRLREELETLRKSQEQLRERLEKYEKLERKGAGED